MYLSQSTLEDILKSKGFSNWFNFFVSSECKKTKHNGSLYNFILNKIPIPANKILHIGDNYDADINKAKTFNIKTFFVPKVKDIFMRLPFFKNLYIIKYNVYEKMLITQIINKQYNNPFTLK